MSGLYNQLFLFSKRYEIVAKIFIDNDLEIKYFSENSELIGDNVVSGLQLETKILKLRMPIW
jgi:hypothetical protein